MELEQLLQQLQEATDDNAKIETLNEYIKDSVNKKAGAVAKKERDKAQAKIDKLLGQLSDLEQTNKTNDNKNNEIIEQYNQRVESLEQTLNDLTSTQEKSAFIKKANELNIDDTIVDTLVNTVDSSKLNELDLNVFKGNKKVDAKIEAEPETPETQNGKANVEYEKNKKDILDMVRKRTGLNR